MKGVEVEYQRWIDHTGDLLWNGFVAFGDDPEVLEDAFYRDLAFGTSGQAELLEAEGCAGDFLFGEGDRAPQWYRAQGQGLRQRPRLRRRLRRRQADDGARDRRAGAAGVGMAIYFDDDTR